MNGNRVRPSRLSLGWAASQFDEKLFKVRRRGSLRRPLSSLMRSAASIAGKDGVDGERASAPTMIEEVRFAADSLLEERVSSEPVSEAQFPGNWEKYRDFYRRGLRIRLSAGNPEPNSIIYDPIPYALEQGIYFCLAGS